MKRIRLTKKKNRNINTLIYMLISVKIPIDGMTQESAQEQIDILNKHLSDDYNSKFGNLRMRYIVIPTLEKILDISLLYPDFKTLKETNAFNHFELRKIKIFELLNEIKK